MLNFIRVLHILFCCFLLAPPLVLARPGSGESCVRPILYTEWHDAKKLYDQGKVAESIVTVRRALDKLANRDDSWKVCKNTPWDYYVNCGSMSIIDDYDRGDLQKLRKEEIDGIKFVRTVLGKDNRELINWLYDYQDLGETPLTPQIREQAKVLLQREFSNLQKAFDEGQKSVAEKQMLMRAEGEFFWRLAAVLKKQGDYAHLAELYERQAILEDSWQMVQGNSLNFPGQWNDVAEQYKALGRLQKAEQVYRMILLRSCDPKSTTNLSKRLPALPLDQILTVVDKGDYQYGRVMYLDKLKEVYLKENDRVDAEKCVRGKLRSMLTFYKPNSTAIDLVKEELRKIRSEH